MISCFTIGSAGGAASYFEKSFNQDGLVQSDNYYVGEKAGAVWQGRGAEILGIQGKEVKKEDFIAFLDGKLPNPGTGEIQDLAKNAKGADRVTGWDFTTSPPKSVSIVGLVGKDERVTEAHLKANERAMAWLEKNASVVRAFDDEGERSMKHAGNLLYATVLHETNRNNEPQIHSHNVIVSAVYDKDAEKWRSLTNEELFALRQGADQIYKSTLAHGLLRAGFDLNYDANGRDFEIAGFNREQIEAFSTRRTEILKALNEQGIGGDAADFHQRQIVTIETRQAKSEQPRDILHSVWEEVAETSKMEVNKIVEKAKEESIEIAADPARSEESLRQANLKSSMNAVLWAVEHLSEREQAFKRTDIELTAMQFSRGHIDDVERAIDQLVDKKILLDRGLSAKGAQLYTTPQAVAQEKEVISTIQAGYGRGQVVFSTLEAFESALAKFEARKTKETGKEFKLSSEQVITAVNLLMHSDTYQGVQGDAGTGKTAALEFVYEAAKNQGWDVMGVATTSTAAQQLEVSSQIPSKTVAAFLHEKESALKLANMELESLKKAVQDRQSLSASKNLPRIEMRRLEVTSDGMDFGTAKYVFDNEKGYVFKAPDTLRNRLGEFLLTTATELSNKKIDSENGERGKYWQDRMGEAGSRVAASLGQKLTTYEKVGMTESIAARNTLMLQKDTELANLQFKVGTKRAEIENLKNAGNKEGRKTMLVMDESTMTGIADAVSITKLGSAMNARMAWQGDVKQHGSVPAGRVFAQAIEAGMNTSTLKETRRFDNATPQTKEAVKLMSAERTTEGIGRLDKIEVADQDLAKVVADRYLKNFEALRESGKQAPQIGVVAITNADRKEINAEVHGILMKHGYVTGEAFTKQHLDDAKLTPAQQLHIASLQEAKIDRLVFRKPYSELGVSKNDVVKVVGYDFDKNLIAIVNSKGKEVRFNPKRMDWFTPMRAEEREYAIGDNIEARANILFDDKRIQKITNGEKGVISSIDKDGATIKWIPVGGQGVGGKSREVRLDNNQLRMIDLSYARTSFKEQGVTNDREIIAVSKIGAKAFSAEAAYVAGSRARDNAEVVTSDYLTLLKKAGVSVEKTTAIDVAGKPKTKGRSQHNQIAYEVIKEGEKQKGQKQDQDKRQLGFALE